MYILGRKRKLFKLCLNVKIKTHDCFSFFCFYFIIAIFGFIVNNVSHIIAVAESVCSPFSLPLDVMSNRKYLPSRG